MRRRVPLLLCSMVMVMAACGGSVPPAASQPTAGASQATSAAPSASASASEATPAGPEGADPAAIASLADAVAGVTAEFESDWGTPSVTPDEPVVLCDTAVATAPGTMANVRFRRPESGGTESSILVDIVVAGSAADAAGMLQELGANLGACGDYVLPDIGAEGVMEASQSTFVGSEGIRWSTQVVSPTPGARFWEGFITTSGPLLVQVMTEVRTVFEASVPNLGDPVALLEQVVPEVIASVE